MNAPFKYFVKVTKSYQDDSGIYVEGIASGTLEDRDDQRMSVDVLKQFVQAIKQEPLPLTNSHPRPGEIGADLGEVVDAAILNDEFNSLWIKAKLDDDNPTNDYLMRKINEGKKFAFSIEGTKPKTRTVWSDRLKQYIQEFAYILPTAISITSQPSYIPSFLQAVIKASTKPDDGIGEAMDSTKELNGMMVGNQDEPPYLDHLTDRGDAQVWLVDGEYVRKNIDEEFTNYGQHYRFDFIPEDELWLDRDAATSDEIPFFIDHLLLERRLMQGGMKYDEALAEADQAERTERVRAGDMDTESLGTLKPGEAHEQLLETLPDDTEIWLVDGELVRSTVDTDFTEGGHGYVYDFVPKDEVWLDDVLEPDERDFVLLHELYERNCMEGGEDYDSAHVKASEIEHKCRENPDTLAAALAGQSVHAVKKQIIKSYTTTDAMKALLGIALELT